MATKTEKKLEGLHLIELADGSTFVYPETITPQSGKLDEEPEPIRLLPVMGLVEAQAFSIVGELLEVVPTLDEAITNMAAGGKFDLRALFGADSILAIIRGAFTEAPTLLIRLGAELTEHDADWVGEHLTLVELAGLFVQVVLLEKARFEVALGDVLESLGADLEAVDAGEDAYDSVVDLTVADEEE